MQLGETIATYDVALALRGEGGKFDVTSPTGEMYHLTCTPNHSITNLQWSGNGTHAQPFLIRKVAEPISSAPEKIETTGAETQSRAAKTPYLVSADENNSTLNGKLTSAAVPEVPQPDQEEKSASNLDLFFAEGHVRTQRPTAWVCLRTGLPQGPEKLITNACTSFNELDTEIRRLHAQLDDVRHRARKKFYQAHTVAAGA